MYKETALGAIRPYHDPQRTYATSHSQYFAHPEEFRVDPFRIFGNLYYVGDRKACPYLIDTGDGLILIDTGYGHELPYLLENIRTLGFRVEDIRIIIHHQNMKHCFFTSFILITV